MLLKKMNLNNINIYINMEEEQKKIHKSNAQRQREWRERQILKFGDDVFKNRQKEIQQKFNEVKDGENEEIKTKIPKSNAQRQKEWRERQILKFGNDVFKNREKEIQQKFNEVKDGENEEVKTKIPKSNAQRQKEWRERQILKFGDEFKKMEKERQQKIYNSKRKLKNISNDDNEEDNKEEDNNVEKKVLPKLKPLKKRVHPIIKKNLKNVSKYIYINFIKKFYKHYTKKELNNDSDIIKAINNEKFSYKKVKEQFDFLNEKFDDILIKYENQLNYVYAIFARIRGLTKFINKLYPYQIRLQNLNEDKRQEKVIPEIKIEKISFDKDDVLLNLKNEKLRYCERILYGLILLLPPRRYEDYRITKITNSIPNEKNDSNYNYYYDGKIYIYNSKSDTRTAVEKDISKIRYIIELPEELNKLIDLSKEYILGREYTQSGVSKLLATATFKIYNIVFNISEIRRIKITEENDKGLSYYEKKELADAMNHSISEQAKYVLAKK